MRYLILFLCLVLSQAAYAASGVNGVSEPAEVNSVTTPDKVNSVSGLSASGPLLEWDGTYNESPISGHTISYQNVADGSGDGGTDTTLIDADSDFAKVTSVTCSSGVCSAGGGTLIDLNEGGIYWRGDPTHSVASGFLIGNYEHGSGGPYFQIQIDMAANPDRIYIKAVDASANEYRGNLSGDIPSGFVNLWVRWKFGTGANDTDVEAELTTGSFSAWTDFTVSTGSASTPDMTDVTGVNQFTTFNIYGREAYSTFRGEVSHLEITDDYSAVSGLAQ